MAIFSLCLFMLSSFCVCLFGSTCLLFIRTQVTSDEGSTLLQDDIFLTNYICNDYVSTKSHILQCSGVRGRGHNSIHNSCFLSFWWDFPYLWITNLSRHLHKLSCPLASQRMLNHPEGFPSLLQPEVVWIGATWQHVPLPHAILIFLLCRSILIASGKPWDEVLFCSFIPFPCYYDVLKLAAVSAITALRMRSTLVPSVVWWTL